MHTAMMPPAMLPGMPHRLVFTKLFQIIQNPSLHTEP